MSEVCEPAEQVQITAVCEVLSDVHMYSWAVLMGLFGACSNLIMNVSSACTLIPCLLYLLALYAILYNSQASSPVSSSNVANGGSYHRVCCCPTRARVDFGLGSTPGNWVWKFAGDPEQARLNANEARKDQKPIVSDKEDDMAEIVIAAEERLSCDRSTPTRPDSRLIHLIIRRSNSSNADATCRKREGSGNP